MSNTPSSKIVWIDCEMTGLDPAVDTLIEVAVVVTDFNLQPVDDGFSVVIKPPTAALQQMNSFVRNMHEKSGLLQELATGADLSQAEAALIAYLNERVTDTKPLVAGNTIGTDRRFLSAQMPQLDKILHYRSIDVSSVKELSRRWYPQVFANAPEKSGNHRALADIHESIKELAYYRGAVFVDTQQAN